MEKIMNLRGNREIKSIKAQEHIGIKPEVTFEIEFDNEEAENLKTVGDAIEYIKSAVEK